MAFWFYFLRKVQGSQKTNLGHLLHEHNKVQIITYQNHIIQMMRMINKQMLVFHKNSMKACYDNIVKLTANI